MQRNVKLTIQVAIDIWDGVEMVDLAKAEVMEEEAMEEEAMEEDVMVAEVEVMVAEVEVMEGHNFSETKILT